MQGEGNQESLNIMGDVDLGLQWWPTDEEADPRHTSNDILQAEDQIDDPDQIAQPGLPTNLSIPESPKDHSTYSHHDSFSDTGLVDYNLEFGGQAASNLLGMTGGSETWTVPTPFMDSTSPQSHPFSSPSDVHQNYQADAESLG
ncbi:hypothetical protein N0V83_007121 [Neocucurbitaria cava]|uniref:Uncharacterized protein n=1 Tax=Neocucurbitaria cava TaxID=798079 RepID=A0A9W8Y4T0_9PLEO|nr:hypothetical protein N0V83_007121 [Neocucurbitaria cava]